MNYRLIGPGDLPEIFDLRAATRENPYSREDLRQLDITEDSVAERLRRATHRGWLCEVGERIVGFAIGDGTTGELCVIAVLPEFEGRGIGSRLLAAVEDWLAAAGWKELWLWTSSDRKKRAFSFYLKHGWVVTESKADILYLRKSLACPRPAPNPR